MAEKMKTDGNVETLSGLLHSVLKKYAGISLNTMILSHWF